MKQTEIELRGTYEGPGACCARTVDHIWVSEVSGRTMVPWYSMMGMSVRTQSGRMLHTPNNTCSLAHFARWARKRQEDGDRDD